MLFIPKEIKDIGGNKLRGKRLVVKEIGQSRCKLLAEGTRYSSSMQKH